LVDSSPCQNVKWRKVDKKERRLVTADEFDRLCDAALKVSKNGQQFCDYLRLLLYSGGRMAEMLRLRWLDVDWERDQLVIGADGESKNHEVRHVDFNPSLEAHLKDMHQRRDEGSVWLFPSPQRGKRNIPSKSFRETLLLAREASGLEHVGFHDTRHHFISMSVMAGIDYMTIAAWVGHKDGGILIGKVYGHLANEHRQRAAQKLVLGTVGIIDGGKEATA
jgi:integrase